MKSPGRLPVIIAFVLLLPFISGALVPVLAADFEAFQNKVAKDEEERIKKEKQEKESKKFWEDYNKWQMEIMAREWRRERERLIESMSGGALMALVNVTPTSPKPPRPPAATAPKPPAPAPSAPPVPPTSSSAPAPAVTPPSPIAPPPSPPGTGPPPADVPPPPAPPMTTGPAPPPYVPPEPPDPTDAEFLPGPPGMGPVSPPAVLTNISGYGYDPNTGRLVVVKPSGAITEYTVGPGGVTINWATGNERPSSLPPRRPPRTPLAGDPGHTHGAGGKDTPPSSGG